MSSAPAVQALDELVDHVRGPAGASLILEYCDYECPYSRRRSARSSGSSANQHALEDQHLQQYADQLGLDVARFDQDRSASQVLERVARDVASGNASGEVLGTPTLFINGRVHRGGYDAATLLQALSA